MNPVVIDTNCLLQIISHGSPYRPIWDAFLAGQYTLSVSNEILDEYQEILEQQITPTVDENVVMLLLNQQNVQLVDPHFRMGIFAIDVLRYCFADVQGQNEFVVILALLYLF